MRKREFFSRTTAVILALTVTATTLPTGMNVKAATVAFDDESVNVMIDSGGYKTEIYGVGTDDWGVTWKNRTETTAGDTYLTDNYRQTVGTVPSNDWASSVVFDQFSESLYAHPLAYRMASNGVQMASPAVTTTTSYVDSEPEVSALLEDDTVELVVGGSGFTAKEADVDVTTDWSYEIVMPNSSGSSSIRAIIAKGTPYAYYKFENTSPTISLGAGATNLTIYKNTTASSIIGLSLKNSTDNSTHYYLVAAPSGTTWTNAGGKLTANLPTGKNYMSVAILPDGSDSAFNTYAQYAYNFITNTVVEWEYLPNSSKVATKYNVETTNMETGATGGDTIIALYPHQWRYVAEGTSFAPYTYSTIRGTMKTVIGSSYVTEMTYNGILSSLPSTDDKTTVGTIMDQLGYLYDYRSKKDDPKWICNLEGQYGGYDTYWIGKNLNTLSDAILIASQYEDDSDMASMKDAMVTGVENYLEFWFDPYQAYQSGNYVDDYFYYDAEHGTLIGYPASYSSDKEMNDHHFHYGYWIKAAATLAMEDKEWAQEWGGMVYEMISDIADANRDGSSYNEASPAKYTFLRNFDIYEGHSWASGVANYEYDSEGNIVDSNGGLAGGNNQESSSEAVNAWASLILWGEAVNDTRIRDLGIYMYTTEVAAIEDYYYDVHDEIFTDGYEDSDNYNIQTVTRLFGGRYDHTAWWTESSIEVTTITMLPLTGASLYFGKYPEKVQAVYDSVSETSKQWTSYVANKEQICKNYGKTDMLTNPETNQDVMSEFLAFADPEAALEAYDISDTGFVENGESRAHTLEYITSLLRYGNQDFTITASWPMALVMNNNGTKTYVAENHTDQAVRVYYSDGAYVDVSANTNYAGAKTGDEENPNVDQGNISGTKQKFTLEIYRENYDGTGYDMTSRTVGVKADNNSYTYTPAEISGFTYDATNKNNNLTVDVTEGTVETVKVYYKRNTYSITYNLDNGTATNPEDYKYGSSFTLNNAIKAGYIFEGWYTDSEFTNKITAIDESTSGNLTLYAKFMDASLYTSYTVEYWIMSDDRAFYSLASDQTETVNSYVGQTVTAEDKAYSGYTLNSNSTQTGTVLPEGQLVLRMYYDIPGNTDGVTAERGLDISDKYEVKMYDTTCTDKSGVVFYYVVYSSQSEAQEMYDRVIAGNYGGFPGYNPSLSSDGSRYEYKIGNLSSGQYVVYAFNDGTGIANVGIANVAEAREKQLEDAVVKADYTVKYYKQNSDYTGYDEVEADQISIEGEAGTGVVAPVKTYDGYVVNSEKSNLTATLSSDGSTVMKLYYDRVTSTTSKHKYILEIYRENLDGQSYEQSTKVVSLEGDDNTFTYTPAEITGFTFDSDNSKNNLTVNVSEGSLETVRAYYSRNSYSITYVLSGASNKNPSSYIYGEDVTLVDATKSGYTFAGWYTDSDYNNQITKIEAGSTGNLKLYAKLVDESLLATYTVEHYKMDKNGQGYTLADSETVDSTVGVNVSAELKSYSGYSLNSNSVTSGTVLSGDKLVLRLYYDLDVTSIITATAGAKLDDNGNVIIYTDKTNTGTYLVYCSEFDTEAAAKTVYEDKMSTHNPSGMPGYIMTQNGDTYEYNLGQKSSSKYLVFIFNRGKGSESETDAYMVKVGDLAASTELATTSYTTITYLQTDSGYTKSTETSGSGYAGFVMPAKQATYPDYVLNTEKSTMTAVLAEDGSTVFNLYYDMVATKETSIRVEINGFQINTVFGGIRTVYSVENTIDDKTVTERGLIYSLEGYAEDSDMYVGSSNAYVRSYAATSAGLMTSTVSKSSTAHSYAMTMKFGNMSKTGYTAYWKVRAYAKLSDGTYEYSDVTSYSIYDVADELYKDADTSQTAKSYLYTNILSYVDETYKK